MANSSYVGLVTCPHCGNENATVHQQQTGTKKGRFYYRCYSEINGNTMRCGTIQSIGQTGQDWINSNMRPIGQQSPKIPDVRPIGQPIAPEIEPVQEQEPIGQPDLAEETQEPENEPIAQEETPAHKVSLLGFLTTKPSRETRA